MCTELYVDYFGMISRRRRGSMYIKRAAFFDNTGNLENLYIIHSISGNHLLPPQKRFWLTKLRKEVLRWATLIITIRYKGGKRKPYKYKTHRIILQEANNQALQSLYRLEQGTNSKKSTIFTNQASSGPYHCPLDFFI